METVRELEFGALISSWRVEKTNKQTRKDSINSLSGSRCMHNNKLKYFKNTGVKALTQNRGDRRLIPVYCRRWVTSTSSAERRCVSLAAPTRRNAQ